MKQYLLTFLLLCFCVSAFSQLRGDGYYRLQNRYTERYVRLRDAYGFVDVSSTDADMSAVLTKKPYNTCLSDPASILYIKSVPSASGYDLYCQGTSLYSVIGYYVKMKQNGDYYQAYAERSGYIIYLADPDNNGAETATLAKFNLKSGMKATQRDWLLNPVSLDDDNNYLGVAPTISCGAKYYTGYYTSFPYSFQSKGMKAYYVTKVDSENGIVVYQEVTTDDIPQATPVFLECSSSEVSQNRLNIHSSSTAAPADNLLKGVYFCRVMNKASNPHNNYVKNDTSTVRVLGVTESGELGYVKSHDTYLPENSSYLTVPSYSPSDFTLMTPDEYKVYIETKTYILTYYVDGTYYASDTLHAGEPVVARPAPEKEGCTFSGWQGLPEKMPANDVDVVGYFTVGLNSMSTEIESVRYYNLIGCELFEPAEGVMIVVTKYRDGSSVRERIVYR